MHPIFLLWRLSGRGGSLREPEFTKAAIFLRLQLWGGNESDVDRSGLELIKENQKCYLSQLDVNARLVSFMPPGFAHIIDIAPFG